MLRLPRFGLVGCLLLLAYTVVTAQEPTSSGDIRTTTALRFAPADSAFFSTSLRMKERWQRLWKSKAVQQVWNTPLVQAGWKEVISNFHEKSGPLQEMLKQPENQQLLELLGDMVSEEFFVIGGANTPRFLTAMMSGFGSAYSTGIFNRFGGGGPGEQGLAQARAFLHGLMEQKKDLVTPEIIIGFKIKDEKVALKQVARLEVLLNGVAMVVPQLTGKVKRQKTGELSFATVTIDGQTMKWDQIPWDQIEEEKGEFEELIAHLKKMKLTISLGNYQGYLILAIGESLNVIERLGKGKKLTELPEMQPLTQHLSKPITNVGYISKAMNSNSGFTQKDADEMKEAWLSMLENIPAPISDEFKKRLEKDIPDLTNDIYKLYGHEPGASMSFAFETARGTEGYSYQYSVEPRLDGSQPLGLLQHVGGDPILAAVGRSKIQPGEWDFVVKWCKKADGYLNEFIFPDFLGKEGEEHAKKVLSSLYPLFKRFDKNTRENFIPALMDGQSAFVIDNKLVSTQWHKGLPESKTPLPLLEPAIVVGVSDAGKLTAAVSEYRRIVNDAIKVLKDMEIAEEFPFKWMEPESRKVEGATLYWYTFPDELMLDGRLMPTGGLSSSVAALTVSNEHAIRLLKATPLKGEGGPLSDTKRKASGAVAFSLSALVDSAMPWVDFALAQEGVPDELQKHKKDIKTILSSLKIFRSYSNMTYVENGATVTHSEWHLRDID